MSIAGFCELGPALDSSVNVHPEVPLAANGRLAHSRSRNAVRSARGYGEDRRQFPFGVGIALGIGVLCFRRLKRAPGVLVYRIETLHQPVHSMAGANVG